ncbi:MAG TPA: C-type lectin domain-containing protein [Kofleriaceae bacterium]
MWHLAILVAFAGCGRIGFDTSQDAATQPDASDATRPDVPAGACANDPRYVEVAGLPSRYKTVALDVSWNDAREDCAADGAYLTIPDDALEAASDAIGDWIGITDEVEEGTWMTLEGVPATFLPWQPGQPDGGVGENCARLDDGLDQLEDRACTDTRDYSCECE